MKGVYTVPPWNASRWITSECCVVTALHVFAFKKKKGPPDSAGLRRRSRQRPTLPRSCPRSTIGAEGLNDRVRNGNGCGPLAMVTGKLNSQVGDYYAAPRLL